VVAVSGKQGSEEVELVAVEAPPHSHTDRMVARRLPEEEKPNGCKGKHSYYLSSAVEAAVAAAATGAELCGIDLFMYGRIYPCLV